MKNATIVNNTAQLVIPAGHDYSYIAQPTASSANCNEYVLKAHYECTRCHKYLDAEQNEVTLEDLQTEKKGTKHNTETYSRIEPTCTEDGRYLYTLCKNCGQIKVVIGSSSAQVAESLDDTVWKACHKYGTATYERDGASCTATHVCTRSGCSESLEGHTETETVTGTFVAAPCGGYATGHYSAAFTKSGFKTQNTAKNSITATELAAHQYDIPTYIWNGVQCTASTNCSKCQADPQTEQVFAVYQKDTDATCTEPETGYYIATFTKACFTQQSSELGKITKGQPNGHSYGDPVYVWNGSSCTATRTCTACEEGTAGHSFGELIPEVPATCTEAGMAAHFVCAECNSLFDTSRNPVTEAQLVIPAKGHRYGDLIPEVPATCTEAGTAAYCVCSECNALFDAARNPVTEAQLVIAAKGHRYGDLVLIPGMEEPVEAEIDPLTGEIIFETAFFGEILLIFI